MTPTDLQEVYASIGRAMRHLQFLEDVVVTYVTMRLRLKPVSLAVATDVLTEQRGQTLGTLLREAQTGGLVEGDVGDAFRLLVQERNWLIHRSMHECNDELHRDHEREAFFRRLSKLTDEAIRLRKDLYGDVARWCAAQGVDVAQAEALGIEQFRRSRDA